jgi:type IV secretory pathway TraG/TraD family ATPase VirD4
MLLAIALAVVTGLLVRSWWYRTPYDVSSRVSYRMSCWPRVRWLDRAFLGYAQGWLREPRIAMSKLEDSVGVVGPTRVNKTSGVGIAQMLFWNGALVSISQTPLLFRATAARRQLLADEHGGKILVYAPTVEGRVEGLVPMRFSPADSTDPNVITLRVASWVQAAQTGRNVDDSDHWRAGASRILRGLFLACAHHPDRPGDFTLVREWLAHRDLVEPMRILRGLGTWGGDEWADSLKTIHESDASKERTSFFSAAENTIEATANPTVSKSTIATDFDPEEFILSRSTLYIFSPTEHQQAVAPLISMLVESLVHTAYRLHREGRMQGRLALSVDDLANVCALPQLESIISQGGGQSVNVWWSLQSLSQLAVHYGQHAAQAIWSATRCKIVFGGLVDDLSIEKLSEVLPEERVVLPSEQETQEGQGNSVRLGRRRSLHVTYRRLLSAAQLREIPDKWAMLLYHNLPPRMVHVPLAAKRRLTNRHMKAWQPVEQPVQQPAFEVIPGEVVPLHPVEPGELEEETGS